MRYTAYVYGLKTVWNDGSWAHAWVDIRARQLGATSPEDFGVYADGDRYRIPRDDNFAHDAYNSAVGSIRNWRDGGHLIEGEL